MTPGVITIAKSAGTSYAERIPHPAEMVQRSWENPKGLLVCKWPNEPPEFFHVGLRYRGLDDLPPEARDLFARALPDEIADA